RKIQEYQQAGRNIRHVGNLTKEQLYKEYQAATVYFYPTNFLEVSCITAMECMACGLPMIFNGIGALPETYGPAPAGKMEDPKFQKGMIDTLFKLLNSEQVQKNYREAGLKKARRLKWSSLAKTWEKSFYSMFKERNNPETLAKRFEDESNFIAQSKLVNSPLFIDEISYTDPVKMTVVMPNCRGQETAELAIKIFREKAHAKHDYIVIGNGVELKAEGGLAGDNIKILNYAESIGVTKAWNNGIKLAQTEHIAIANDDVFMMDGWDVQLLGVMDAYDIDMISPNEH
ncbi:unnamed protein product, partial [marine sediment metagenome]